MTEPAQTSPVPARDFEPEPPVRGWTDRLAVLVPVLLCVVLFAPVLSGVKHFFLRDVLTFSYPEKLWTAESLRTGRLPTWDPRLDGGVPHLAYVTYGVLDPLNVLLLPFSTARALDLLIIGHVIAAALLCFGLARSLALSPIAAATAASLFALGGYLQGLTSNLPYLSSAAYLAGALWALEVFVVAPRMRAAAVLALALALTFVAGDPQLVFVALLLAPIRVVLAGREGLGLRLLWLQPAVALFAGLILGVLLPGTELLGQSDRSGGIDLAVAEVWSLYPLRLIEMLVPFPFDTVAPDIHWWGGFMETARSGEPWVQSLYTGGATLLLPIAFVGLVRRRDEPASRGLMFLAVASALGLLLALGAHAPFYGWMHGWVPHFDRFRYPAKLFVWVAIASSVLAGHAIDRVTADGGRWIRRMGVALALFGGLTAVLAMWVPTAASVDAFATARGARLNLTSPEWAAANLRVRLRHTGVAAVAIGGLLLARRRWPRLVAPGLLLVAAIDLLVVARAGQTITSTPFHSLRPPVLEAIDAIAIDRRDQRLLLVPDFTAFAADPAPDGRARIELLGLRHVMNLSPNLPLAHGYRMHGGYLPARPRQTAEWWSKALLSRDPVLARRALQVTSTALVIAGPTAAGLGQLPGLVAVRAPLGFEPAARLLRVVDPLPRVYVAARAEQVADADGALALLARPGFVPGRDVAVETVGALADQASARGAVGGEARIEADLGSRLVIRATVAPGGGWMVVTDTYDPGWRATIDGRATAVVRANGLQRAIRIEEGSHEVVFDYAPTSLRAGLTASGLALVACVAMLLVDGPVGRRLRARGGRRESGRD